MSVYHSVHRGSSCVHYPWCHWSVTGDMGPPPPTCLNLFTWNPSVHLVSVWVDEISTNLTTLYDVVTTLSHQLDNMTKNFEDVTKELEETKKKLKATEEKLKIGKDIPTKRSLFTTTKRSVNQSELSTLPAGWKWNHINTVPIFYSIRRCVQCSAVRRRFLPAWRTGHLRQRDQ